MKHELKGCRAKPTQATSSFLENYLQPVYYWVGVIFFKTFLQGIIGYKNHILDCALIFLYLFVNIFYFNEK